MQASAERPDHPLGRKLAAALGLFLLTTALTWQLANQP